VNQSVRSARKPARQASRLPFLSFWPVFAAVWATVFAGSVQAHPFLQDSWWVVVETNRLVMRVSATLREVAVAQKIQLPTNGVAELARLQAALTNHGDYLVKALKLQADGVPLAGEVLDWQLVGDLGPAEPPDSPLYFERTHAAFDLEFPFPAGQPPREISFGHAVLKEHRYAPGVPWDVTYALTVKDAGHNDLAAGLVRMDLPFTLALPSAMNAIASDPALGRSPDEAKTHASPVKAGPLDDFKPASPAKAFTAYLRLGIHHILTGYDHLLFLCALALAALKLSDFFKLIATFTVAHSITVTLSALNLVRLPPWFVEPFIAASIMFVAVENLAAPKRAAAKSRLLLAFGFGLVHGLGFAAGLNDALGGVGGSALAGAILAFCLGVEFGHLLVGLPFWSVLRAGRAEFGDRFGTHALRAGSAVVALGGAMFFIAAIRQYWSR
jgi:hydrogenase/urease accessory protein HupE